MKQRNIGSFFLPEKTVQDIIARKISDWVCNLAYLFYGGCLFKKGIAVYMPLPFAFILALYLRWLYHVVNASSRYFLCQGPTKVHPCTHLQSNALWWKKYPPEVRACVSLQENKWFWFKVAFSIIIFSPQEDNFLAVLLPWRRADGNGSGQRKPKQRTPSWPSIRAFILGK